MQPTMRHIRAAIFSSGSFRALIGLAMCWVLLSNAPFSDRAFAEQPRKQEELNLGKDLEKKGNILDYVFGQPPPMPTDHGILVVGAYLDDNGNGRRDGEEKWLKGEITCVLEGVDYLIPAFIPGLKPERRYQLECAGVRFQPLVKDRNLFFQRRGEIMQIDLACEDSGKPVGRADDPSLGLSLQESEFSAPPKDRESEIDTPRN